MKHFSTIFAVFLLLAVLTFRAPKIPAQETAVPGTGVPGTAAQGAGTQTEGSESAGDNPDETEENSEASYIEMDIKTSTLMELAAWCRELGLSEGGSRDDLAARLRSHYNLPAPRSGSTAGQRVITIESAKTTEYFTLEVVDEEYARLKGDVIISLKDGNAVHRIKAWEILYNRTRNVMTATGGVEYVKEEGNTRETFKGDTITVNLDNWSSIFMDGASEKSMAGQGSAYRFAGTVITRTDEEVTVLTGAEITNPANNEALWSLHASKLWLLPGNDFAFLNAVLRVGNIPLLYIPAFFYPADEIYFHPVLGYRTREGTFLQTTTYLLGRPKSSGQSENSLTKIFGGDADNVDKVREGVFLRESKQKVIDPSRVTLSAIFDAYANMGYYLGTDLNLPAKGAVGATNLSAGLGLTRDIYMVNGNYTPFENHDGESNWNSGMLFSIGIPLRYRVKADGSFKMSFGSLSWSLPFYSDPYVERDFMRRSEILDWLGMLREGVSAASDEANTSQLNSYEWKLSSSFTPNVKSLDPYISSLTVSSATSTLLFSERVSRSYSGPWSPPNPARSFFFPNRFTVFSVSAAVAGTPYKSGNAPVDRNTTETGPAPGDAMLSDVPISPWEVEAQETEVLRDLPDTYNFRPPALSQRFTLANPGRLLFSADYRLVPSAASELQFRSSDANWREKEDINWGEVSTVLSRFRSDANVGFNLSHGSLYTGALRLAATGSWQDYLYLNEGAEEFSSASAIKTARDRAGNETYLTSSWDFSNTLKPFYQNETWSATSFQHSVRGLLAKTKIDTTGDSPSWDWVAGSWDKDNIDAHQVTANMAARVKDKNQTLSISAVLPPEDAIVSTNAAFRAWISETSVRGRVLFPFDSEERKVEPLYFTEILRFGTQRSFQQYVVYDPELGEFTTSTSSFTFSAFTASFSALYAQPYRYNHNGSVDNSMPNGWIQLPDKELVPQELRFAFNRTFAQSKLWEDRFSFSITLNTSLAFDLQRHTNSKYLFSLAVKLGLTSFLDLVLSTNSENVVVFKYFQTLPFFDLPTQLYPGQETNFFVDLFNSFRFDNSDLRRRSGFKMKALDLSLIHHLGDWNAKLSMKLSPYLPQGATDYKFNNEISFLVQWVPIGEIRTQIDYSKELLIVK